MRLGGSRCPCPVARRAGGWRPVVLCRSRGRPKSAGPCAPGRGGTGGVSRIAPPHRGQRHCCAPQRAPRRASSRRTPAQRPRPRRFPGALPPLPCRCPEDPAAAPGGSATAAPGLPGPARRCPALAPPRPPAARFQSAICLGRANRGLAPRRSQWRPRPRSPGQ